MTEAGGTVYYYWKRPDGAVVRNTRDPAEFGAANPKFTFLYGASCRIDEKYTFKQLKDTSYVLVTFEEYSSGKVEKENIHSILISERESIPKNGFAASVQSNYRIIYSDVKLLSSDGKVIYSDRYYPEYYCFNLMVSDSDLNAKIKKLEAGSYTVTVDVKSGPALEVGADIPVSRAIEVNFVVE